MGKLRSLLQSMNQNQFHMDKNVNVNIYVCVCLECVCIYTLNIFQKVVKFCKIKNCEKKKSDICLTVYPL